MGFASQNDSSVVVVVVVVCILGIIEMRGVYCEIVRLFSRAVFILVKPLKVP